MIAVDNDSVIAKESAKNRLANPSLYISKPLKPTPKDSPAVDPPNPSPPSIIGNDDFSNSLIGSVVTKKDPETGATKPNYLVIGGAVGGLILVIVAVIFFLKK